MNDPQDFRTPGQLIKSLLEKRGWSQRTLALVLSVDETGMNKIVAGKRQVDAEMALALADVLGAPAEQFLELQKSYDLARARIEAAPDPGRTDRALLLGDLPVAEMIRRGWLPGVTDVRDVANLQVALARFFGVPTMDQIEILPHAPKKTAVSTPVTPAQLAWLYRVRQIADEMMVPRYSPGAVRQAVSKLSSLLGAAEEARHAPRILAEAGIRFAIVESLPAAKIDGVCFWLNDFAPVIGMSIRYDRLDNFWFVLRHEIEHVLQMHGKAALMFDADLEGDRAGFGPDVRAEERVANEAAAWFCVPAGQIEGFVSRKQPFFAERDILGFAKTLGVHPALVAGQLQRRIGRYDRFRNLLVKVRSIVGPSAVMDGWGDVVPVEQ